MASAASVVMIRPFTLDDVQQLINVAQVAMPHAWDAATFKDCFKEDYYGWVLTAEQGNDEIIGFVIALCHVDECELLNIAIKPDVQHSGLGGQLLQQVVEFVREKGLQCLPHF